METLKAPRPETNRRFSWGSGEAMLRVEAEEGESWQALLCAGTLAEEATFPGALAELMFAPLEALEFPVDVVLHAHLVASTPNARYVELFPDDKVLNFRRLVDHQLVFKDGDIILPQEPGLGFGFDAAAVAKYALEPWG